jgi:hypothetical protein
MQKSTLEDHNRAQHGYETLPHEYAKKERPTNMSYNHGLGFLCRSVYHIATEPSWT